MRIVKKVSLKIVLLQLVSLFFFEQAFLRFYYFLNADFYECFLKSYPDKLDLCLKMYADSGATIGQLLSQPNHYLMYGLSFGLLVTFTVNLKCKKSMWNSFLLVLLYLGLFFAGVFKSCFFDKVIRSSGAFFSSKILVSSLIASLIAFILGILLVWLSVSDFTHQNEK